MRLKTAAAMLCLAILFASSCARTRKVILPAERPWVSLSDACVPGAEAGTFTCPALDLAHAYDALVNLSHDNLELQARLGAAAKTKAIVDFEHQVELGAWYRQWPIVGTVGVGLGLGLAVGCAHLVEIVAQ